MRFSSEQVGGFQVFAVTGTNTMSFAIDAEPGSLPGLLGFAIKRSESGGPERDIDGFKVFRSVIPNPTENTRVKTWDHPMQGLFWDDFTGKPNTVYTYKFIPFRGTPQNPDRTAAPIGLTVMTERLFSSDAGQTPDEHDIFFNRGVASSQAYKRRFNNMSPSALALNVSQAKADEALQWLTRELDDAIVRFIDNAQANDQLLCCFYEFRYKEVCARFKDAIDRGVDVQIIVDAKDNGAFVRNRQTGEQEWQEAYPRTENLAMLEEVGIPDGRVTLRENNKANIQHNKFMVLVRGGQAQELFTGSTNLSLSGVSGQTNVGHWVRNADVAARYQSYWDLLRTDPGSVAGDTPAAARQKKKKFRDNVEALSEVPGTYEEIQQGITTVFSPRSGQSMLELYVKLVDSGKSACCVTLAFGINELFKQYLLDNTTNNHVVFLLLEKKDTANPRSTQPFVVINASNNVYKAWGSYIQDPVYQWVRETNARILRLGQHVAYVHSKFLLMDPLSEDPIVVTGSANFSKASTVDNDENMLIIRGNQRVADIYFTEFNRLFNHYYFRAVVESTTGHTTEAETAANLFLDETGTEWQKKYKPGSFRRKRVDIYTGMQGFTQLNPAGPGE